MKKKVLYLLVLAVMICGCFCACAEEIDLDGLSDEQIVELLQKVTEEMVRRGIEKSAKLPQGTYIAGRDIPCGRYVWTCLAKGNEWGNLTVYAHWVLAQTTKFDAKQLLWNVVSAPDEGEEPDTVFLTLNEGDELRSGVPFSLTIMTGIVFR